MHRTQPWLSICVALALGAEAAKTWVSIPIRAPDRLLDDSLNRHQADVSVGTPPQNTSFFVSIGGTATHILTPQCLFCPQEGDYDPKYSSSAKIDYSNRTGDAKFGGFRGNETITFGGVLQDVDSPLTFVDVMSPKFQARLAGGHLGLLVPPANDTLRQRSLLHRLNEQDQLLNPVWGLRLGGADPRLTIGALDPNEYQGDINWVPVLELEGTPAVQISALRGYQGAPLPIQYPITAWMDSFARGISIQNLMAYVANDTLIGPQESISIQLPRNQSFGILCNDTVTPNTPLEFSVEINGVAYPINKTDLVRPSSGLNTKGHCNVGIVEASDSLFGLGMTFLRSVYLAYRFPTETCPAYFGFAIPKGFPVPSPTQKPVATPTDAGTCLSFVAPSSTPTPTIATHTGLFGSNGQKYRVYSKPDDQVELRGVDELKERKLTGGSVQADG